MVKVAERSSNYFTKEDHNAIVVITDVEQKESSKGSSYLVLSFEADGKEGDTGFNNYITEKALPYTAERLQSILVHNAKDEKEAQAIREGVAALDDDQFAEVMAKKLVGKEAYLHMSNSDSINANTGKPYLERNLAAWEAKPFVDTAATAREIMGDNTMNVNPKDLPF